MFYDLRTIKVKSFRFYNVNSSDLSEVWCLKENENAILKKTEKRSYGESHAWSENF